MRRIPIGLAALIAAAFLVSWPAAAAERHAALVVDGDTGAVLHAVEANARWAPASLTKMMTVYMAFAEIEAGRLAFDEVLTVSSQAAAQPATELGLASGEKISVEDAIKATIVRSANDAAVVLAERIAGSEDEFARHMTEKAHELGMAASAFRNASGLPDPGQVTTAHDMAVLALALIRDFPQHFHLFKESQLRYGRQSLAGYNGLLVSYDGADGIKTGFTCDSGYNIVASAVRDGRRIVAVYLGATSNGSRNQKVAALLNQAFADELDGNGLTLAALATPSDAPLPKQLGPDLCVPGAAATASGRLPGWGVIFGAFPQKAKAQSVIKEMRGILKSTVSGGQAMPLKRTQEDTTLYSALVVGLGQEQATASCRKLWELGHYCLALRPEVLNNPQALWR